MLFAAWPLSTDTRDSIKMDFQVYMLALEGATAVNTIRAVKAFVGGKVPDHNNDFRPRPATLAEYVRSCDRTDDRIREIRQRTIDQTKRLTNEFQHQMTAEDRAAHVASTLGRVPDRAPVVREPEFQAADRRAKPWHDKAELSASMERIRAHEEARGQPLPETKP